MGNLDSFGSFFVPGAGAGPSFPPVVSLSGRIAGIMPQETFFLFRVFSFPQTDKRTRNLALPPFLIFSLWRIRNGSPLLLFSQLFFFFPDTVGGQLPGFFAREWRAQVFSCLLLFFSPAQKPRTSVPFLVQGEPYDRNFFPRGGKKSSFFFLEGLDGKASF